MPRPKTSADHKRALAAERKRRQRRRQRDDRLSQSLLQDAAHEHIRGSFAAFLSERNLSLFESLHAGGVQVGGDLASENHEGVYPEKEEWEGINGVPLTTLNRATLMIGAFLDAAAELAGLMNEFKLAELDRRIVEAEARQASIAEIEALHQIKKRYRRTIQPRLPAYWVQSA